MYDKIYEEIIDIGDTVVCDRCNADYSDSKDLGGMLVGTNAYCPECQVRFLEYYRTKDPTVTPKDIAFFPLTRSFKDWVLKIRDGDNTIKITTY